MPDASSLHELSTLIRSFHSLIVIESTEEQRARSLVEAASKSLGLSFYEWSISQGLQFGAAAEAGGAGIATTHDPEGVLRHLLALDREGLYLLKDFGDHLQDATVARLLREVCQRFHDGRSTVVLTGSHVDLPAGLEHHASFLPLELPGREALRRTLETLAESLRTYSNVHFDLDARQVEQLIDAVRGLTLNQARQAVAYAALQNGRLDGSDIPTIVDRKARTLQDSGLLEYYPPGDNEFEIGGFEGLEAWLARAAQGFTREAAALNLAPPRGLLLVGVQGCGKSLAAKSIARRWQQPLLKLDAARLYDKYIGESEKNLRRALALAESLAPAVLWVDELEKAFGSADGGIDGGVSRRIQGYLLTWLQEKASSVFVVATANDVFSLPPELMRKGRFDEIFFVDLPGPDERQSIFEIHLRLRKQAPEQFDAPALVGASEGMSGAEIEQAVVAALYRSLHERTPLRTEQILRELQSTVPLSVSRREDIARLRALARRFTPVNG